MFDAFNSECHDKYVREKQLLEIRDTTVALIVENTNLSNSTFHDVDLSHATLTDVRWQAVSFTNADMRRACFRDVNLSGVEIVECNIAGMKINDILVEDLLAAYQSVVSQKP